MKDDGYPDMRGRMPPIAKLYYINRSVYYVAKKGRATMEEVFRNQSETVKSGNAEDIRWIERLARFAKDLGLIRIDDRVLNITESGKRYFESRDKENPWDITNEQADILRKYVREDVSRNGVIYSINTLLRLVDDIKDKGILKDEFSKAINRDDTWNSDKTRRDYLRYGLDYLKRLNLIDPDTLEPKVDIKNISSISEENLNLFDGLFFEEGEKDRLRKRIKTSLDFGKNLVLFGPPGTGKTTLAKSICEVRGEGRWSIVMPTSDTSIEELVETIEKELPTWIILDGIDGDGVKYDFLNVFNSIDMDDEIGYKVLKDSISIVEKCKSEDDMIEKDEYFDFKDNRIILTVDTYDDTPSNILKNLSRDGFSFIPVNLPKSEHIDVDLMKDYIEYWDEIEMIDFETIEKTIEIWDIINDIRSIGPGIIKEVYRYLLETDDISGAVIQYLYPYLENIDDDELEKFLYKVKERLDMSSEELSEII